MLAGNDTLASVVIALQDGFEEVAVSDIRVTGVLLAFAGTLTTLRMGRALAKADTATERRATEWTAADAET